MCTREKKMGRLGSWWSRPAPEFGQKVFIKEAVERNGKPKRDWEQKLIEVRFVGHHGSWGSARTVSSMGWR